MAAGTAASAEQTEASPAAAAALAAGETSAAEQSELSSTDAAALAEMEEIESKDEDVLGTRGRGRTRGGKTQGSGRSPSNIRLCWNCEEIETGDHKASTCDKPKKKDGDEDKQASNDENEDEKARNEEIANQWLIDDVVKELIEMELKQREREGDTEGLRQDRYTGLSLKSGKWSRNGSQ